MKPFSPELKARVKVMFVDKGLTAAEISKQLHGMPSPQTISGWALKGNWKKSREDVTQAYYDRVSPGSMAQKILGKIAFILDQDDKKFTSKDADALAKLRVTMERIMDKKYQIPMMYEVLEMEVEFLSKNYPALATPDLFIAIRHFKNELKSSIEDNPVSKVTTIESGK